MDHLAVKEQSISTIRETGLLNENFVVACGRRRVKACPADGSRLAGRKRSGNKVFLGDRLDIESFTKIDVFVGTRSNWRTFQFLVVEDFGCQSLSAARRQREVCFQRDLLQARNSMARINRCRAPNVIADAFEKAHSVKRVYLCTASTYRDRGIGVRSNHGN